MLFNQSATLQIEGLTIVYPNFSMNWNYKTEADNTPAVLEVTVFNLSDTSINGLKINQKCIFQFGYDDDIGVLCSGYLKGIETTKGVDKETKLTILEASLSYSKDINVSYERLTKASYIIEDIAKKSELFVKKLDLVSDFRFETGYSAKGKSLDIIKKIVDKTNSKLTIKDNFIYIYNENTAKEGNIIIDYTSGLIKEPKKNQDITMKFDYVVECLPIYQLKKGDIFSLQANGVKGNMRIKSFEINDWVAVYEVGEVK